MSSPRGRRRLATQPGQIVGIEDARQSLLRSRGTVAAPFEILLLRPPLCTAVAAIGEQLRFSRLLPDRLRETAIVATATAVRCDFELASHLPIARRVGVSQATIDSLTGAERAAEPPADESAVVAFCQEAVRQHEVANATYERLRGHLSDEQVVEACVLIGYYGLLAVVLNVLDI